MKGPHYSGKSDGNIKEYLKHIHEENIPATFIGYEPFKQLWDMEVVCPGITSIRLMHNLDRGDEHYMVMDETHLEGIDLQMHSGQQGFHDTKEILTKTDAKYWEINNLHPKAFR